MPDVAAAETRSPLPVFPRPTAPLHAVVRNLLLEEELRCIVQEFDRQAIQLVVLKGIPLALRLFGAIDCRVMMDNDLLVRRTDAPRALRCLRALGYRSIDCRTLGRQLDVDYQYRLLRPLPGGVRVHAELHWNAFPEDLFPFPEALLWEHCEPFDCGSTPSIAVFDRPLTLVHLAAHFALSDFAVPSILVDVAQAWNLWYADSDPGEAIELADRTGLIHVLDFALLAAADLGLLAGDPPAIRSPRARRLRRFLPARDLAVERPAHDYGRKAAVAMLAEPRRIPRWLWKMAFPPLENLAAIEKSAPGRMLCVRYLTRPPGVALRALGMAGRAGGRWLARRLDRLKDRARKAARLRPGDWLLLGQSLVLLGAIRAALFVLPFGAIVAWLERSSADRRSGPSSGDEAKQVAWAVTVASRFVCGATCLTQALAARVLLARRGIPSALHLGVAKGEASSLEGHAWLEGEGAVLLGDGDLDRYAEVMAWHDENCRAHADGE